MKKVAKIESENIKVKWPIFWLKKTAMASQAQAAYIMEEMAYLSIRS